MRGFGFVFLFFLFFCSESRTAAADGSVEQTASERCPDMVLMAPPPDLPHPSLRPLGGQAS